MTKELVEAAIGRPPKEQEVIREAEKVLEHIASAKHTIKEYENRKKNAQESLKAYEHTLELLKQGKYKLKETKYSKTGYGVEYEKDA